VIRRTWTILVLVGAAAAAQQSPETYRRLLQNDPHNPQLLSNLGVALFLEGADREALPYLLRAVAIAPDLAAPNLFAGLCLTRMDQPKQALPLLERAFRRDPKGPLPALALGRAHVALRDYRAANRYYAAAAERDASNAEAWYGLGITYRNLLDWTAARIAALDAGAEGSGAPPRAPERISREQILALLAAVDKRPSDLEALARLARGLRPAAVQALSRAVALEPDSVRAHLLLAEAARDQGDLAQAVAEYDRAIRLRPDLPASYLGLATAYWKAGELDSVLAPLEQALRLAPRDPEANGILADVLARRGDFARARQAAETALQHNPELAHARVALARIELAEGKPAAAVHQLRQVLAGDLNGSRHYLLYRAQKQLGRDAEALAAFERFRRLRARAQSAGEAADRSVAEP